MTARRRSRARQTTLHSLFFVLTLVVMYLSGQNPRALLYANLAALIYRMVTVWYLASWLPSGPLLARLTRVPDRGDRGKPWRDARTGDPAGIGAYIFAVLIMTFMLGCLQLLVSGTVFLAPPVILPELAWAAGLALVFWWDDLAGGQLIVDPQAPVNRNLGYNTPPMNFMLAAIFIGGAVLVVSANITVWMTGRLDFGELWIDWVVIFILAGLKYCYEIAELWRPRRRLP